MALIDLILQHPDVVKQASRNRHLAWCPWHNDKGGRKPHLDINTSKGIAKCFVCEKGGGPRSFQTLARAWGIPVEREDGRRRKAPPPVMDAPAAIAALKERYKLHDDTVKHFQLTAAPDSPSPNRRTRGAWIIPTPVGKHYKAFGRSVQPKYWWSKGTDTRSVADPYGAEDLVQGTETVYLVNGEPSVWCYWQAGVSAVCPYGEGNFSADHARALKRRGVTQLRIVFDLDQGGEHGSRSALRACQEADLDAVVLLLGEYLGDGGDVADLYRFHKADADTFRVELEALPPRRLPPEDPLEDTPFFIRNRRVYKRVPTRDGTIDHQLSNGVIHTLRETLLDDGEQRTRSVTYSAELDDGTDLPPHEVRVEKTINLDWLANATWGTRFILAPGRSSRDDMRFVIQRLANARGITQETVYEHTGWRKLDGGWTFLKPSGGQQREGLSARLPNTYQAYDLPVSPEDAIEAVRASLRFLDVARRHITIPMLAAVYLAPLQSIIRADFTLWLLARTGSFKSTLAALVMSHFGRFVKGGEKVDHCGGGIVYHRHDEKGLNWEPGGVRSGAGVCKSGVSQESSGSSETWEAAFCRLRLRR